MGRKFCVVIILFLISINGRSQKFWDGEAGDGMWHTPKNWYPDGIPGVDDEVFIDNSRVSADYNVFIGNGDVINIRSLSITPSGIRQITLEISKDNTQPTALNVLTSEKNIILGKNAVLVNRSGAATGNVFSLNGSMYISNGGRYLHKTIRGNAYLISKLEVDVGSRKGIIEFDVPGNAGYTLSLSGRRFGSLVLSANESLKKSYSGNGANSLIIEGDLMVGENTLFTSTLSNFIQVNGDLVVKGSCSFSHGTAYEKDSSFILGGDSSKILITGGFNTGSNFKSFILASKVNKLASNLSLENGIILLPKNVTLFLDTFYMKSKKEISIMQNVWIETANPRGISKDTMVGTLRTPVLKFGDSFQVTYSAKEVKYTGESLPASIKSLRTEGGGTLILSNALEVTDTLNLVRGIILSDAIKKLTFSGTYLYANEHAFVDGIFHFIIPNDGRVLFPIGKNNYYAPIYINCKSDESIEAEYIDSGNEYAGNPLEFPLKNLSQIECWKISANRIKSIENTRTMIFTTKPTTTVNSNTCVVRLNDALRWEALPLLSNNPVPYAVGATTNLTTSIYTFGNIQQVALSYNRFELQVLYINGKNILNWRFDRNENTRKYVIEGSMDGHTFKSVDSLNATSNETRFNYTFELTHEENQLKFFRIRSEQTNNTSYYSNIVLIRMDGAINVVYPNPCFHQLFIKTSANLNFQIWIVDKNGRKIILPYQKVGKEIIIEVSSLDPGIYRLMGCSNGIQMIHSFIKL